MNYELDTRHDARLKAKVCERWCHLGGGSTTQVTKNETDPQIKALMLGNYAKAGEVADTPFQAYTGERVAGFNPTQTMGQGGLLAAAHDPTGTNNLNSAIGGIFGAMNSANGMAGFQPRNVTAPNVDVQKLSGTDLAPYMNPFQKQVIDATMTQLGQQRGQQEVSDNASATAAHAFGGSRQGVQRALTAEGLDRNTGGILAGLNSDNFRQAQSAALSDIGQQNTVGMFNAGNAFDASRTNAANDITGAGVRLNASNSAGALGGQIASLSDQQLRDALTRAGVITSVGDAQQSQQQSVNDSAYEEFMRQLNYPKEQQSIRNTAIGLLPNDGTQTGTATKKYGLGDFLMAGISGASKAAAGGAFG